MATPVRDPHTETTPRLDDPMVEPTPVARPAGGSGIAVYDRNPAQPIDPALRPATPAVEPTPTGTTPYGDRVPVEPRSTGSILTWLIAAAILIVIAYFLFQLIF